MTSLKHLFPLFVAAAFILSGNGVLGTLIALRATAEGFSTTFVGVISAGYFVGFLMGCLRVPVMISMVGHIRTFAALAALLAATTLLFTIFVEPVLWIVLRTIQGFCFCGVLTVIESWLNESAKNTDRGRVLGIYRVLDMAVVTGSQVAIPLFGITEFIIFSVTSILFCLSLIPVSLSDRSKPSTPIAFKFDLRAVWRLSPLACLSTIAVGLTNASFRSIGPLYGESVGFDAAGVATFMAAGILGAGTLQLPLSYFSDRYSRRSAIVLCSAGAALAGTFITSIAKDDPTLIYVGIFLFGAFALPLYSLSAAHANDMAPKGGFVLVAAGLTFFYAIGAIIGPLLSAILMNIYGGQALFFYTTTVHSALIFIALFRIRVGPKVPRDGRTRYVALLRTSPVFHRLARRSTGTVPPKKESEKKVK